MKKLLTLLVFFVTSCTHEKEGQIVKMSDGNYYILEQAAPHEAYNLRKINVNQIDTLRRIFVETGYLEKLGLSTEDPNPPKKLHIGGQTKN